MIYGIYSIRDSKTGFLSLMLDQNDNSAMRNFQHACANAQSLFFTHAADYDLCKLGSFDSSTGNFDIEPIKVLLNGSDAKGAVAGV